MPQSARATFKLALAAVQSLLWRSVSMPQSARATFKRTRIPHDDGAEVWFQCLNRHEQPSSEEFEYLVSPSLDVSMPQSARATFKLRPLSPVARRLDVSMPQSARATFKLHRRHLRYCLESCFNASIGTSNLQAHRLAVTFAHGRQGFNASIGTSNLQAPNSLLGVICLDSFNASIGTSNLQAQGSSARSIVRPVFQCLNRHEQPSSVPSTGCPCRWHEFQCLNRHEQPSSFARLNYTGRLSFVSMPQSARATFKLSSDFLIFGAI